MPDHHDAALLIQLAQWSSMIGFDAATKELFSDDFSPADATIESDAVRPVLQFGETIGTLTKNGLLDQGLVTDWLWVSGLWERVAPAAIAQREKYGVPQLYENFEALARTQG